MPQTGPVVLPNPAGADAKLERILSWSPDGRRLLLDDRSSTGPYLVDLETWTAGQKLEPLDWAQFSSDGRRLAFAPRRPPFRVQVLHIESGAEFTIANRLPARSVAMSTDGTRVAFADGYRVKVYRIGDPPECDVELDDPGREQLHTFVLQGTKLLSLSVTSGDQRELTHVWDLRSPSLPPHSVTHEALPMARSALVRNGSAILRAGVVEGVARLGVHEVTTGRERHGVTLPTKSKGYIHSIAASLDGGTVVVDAGPANGHQRLFMFRGAIDRPVKPEVIAELDWRISFLTVSPDGGSVLFFKGDALHRLLLPPEL